MTKTITDYQVLFSGSQTITPPPLGGPGGGVGGAFDISTDFRLRAQQGAAYS